MKRIVAILLTLVVTFEPVLAEPGSAPKVGAGVFMSSIYDKMNQPIYIPGTKRKIITSKPLWFESDSRETSEYAELVASKAPAKLGDNAVIFYSSIGDDNFKVNVGTASNPQEIDMVCSSIEYYFTNQVFIEKKYKEALIDLLQYRAEVPAKQQTVDETAIPGTLWVAEQNGVKISMDDVKKEFAAQIGAQIDAHAQVVIDYYRGSVKNVDAYMAEFANALKAYYADPTTTNLDALIDKGDEIDRKTLATAMNPKIPIYVGWMVLIMSVVGKLSSSLATLISNRGKERTAQTSLTPVTP